MSLNYLDIILLAPLVFGFIKGLKKGLVFEAASVLALILGIWGAIKFSGFTAEFLNNQFNWDFDQLPIVAFVITFAGIVVAINFIAKIVDKFLDMIAMDFLNKLAGGVFGLLKIGIIIGVIIFITQAVQLNLHIIPEDVLDDSIVYNAIVGFTDKIIPMIDFDELKESGNQVLKQI